MIFDHSFFLVEFRNYMQSIKPISDANLQPFLFKSLNTSSHDFIRNEPITSSLDPPYLGSYKVVTCSYKHFYNIWIPKNRIDFSQTLKILQSSLNYL